MARSLNRSLALNAAGWMDASVRCLGIETHYDEATWWRAPGGPSLYLAAVITDSDAPPTRLEAELATIRSAWSPEGAFLWEFTGSLELGPCGLVRVHRNPWFLREPGPKPPLGALPQLDIEVATTPDQLAAFERANLSANQFDDLLGQPPSSVYAASSLEEPGIVYLMGRVGGEIVTSSIAYISDDIVGVYGIATDPRFRRSGFGTALIREIVGLRPDLPTWTWPAPESVAMYTPFGFVPVGEVASWVLPTA